MKYLLDTNILSETRKRKASPKVIAWLDARNQEDLFISVLTLGELTKGITLLHRSDPRVAASLRHWCNGLEHLFSDHILPIDCAIARRWGILNAKRPFPVIDSLLAATALENNMTLVTRNLKDVERSGVTSLNPWEL